MVAWGEGAIFPYYNNASSNIRVVGKEISLLTLEIAKIFFPADINWFRIHCIGHSLGSHICGHAGDASKVNKLYYDRLNEFNLIYLIFTIAEFFQISMIESQLLTQQVKL